MSNGFILEGDQKKIYDNVILPKLEKGERVNIFFSTNYYSGGYYYLYQLHVVGQFAKYTNVHFYIAFTDTVSATKSRMHFTIKTAKKEEIEIKSSLNEIKSVLLGLGVEESRIHLYKSSDIWHRYMSYSNQNVMNFYKGMSVFPINDMAMDREWTSNWFVPKGTKINIAYGIQKQMDLLATNCFEQLFPDEIEGKINLVFVGALGSRMLMDIRAGLVSEGLIEPNSPVVALIKKIPMFGHTASIHSEFVSPNWDMTVEQIYNVIDKFSVSKEQIYDLFNLFLNKFLDDFIIIDKEKRFVGTQEPIKLSAHPLENQRLILAHNLHKFLKRAKEGAKPGETKNLIYISRRKEVQELGKILKSDIALKILRYANGDLTASDIARKLDKHSSNLNPIIKNLKSFNLLETNEKGKLERKVNRLHIDLPSGGR